MPTDAAPGGGQGSEAPGFVKRAKDAAIGAGVRMALTPAHLAGPRVAPTFADAFGPVFGRAPFNRKRVERAVERLLRRH